MRHRGQNHAISSENIRKAIDDWRDRQDDEGQDVTHNEVDKWLTTFQDELEDDTLAEELDFRRRKGRTQYLPNSEPDQGYGWYINTYDFVLLETLSHNGLESMLTILPRDHPINQDTDLCRILFDAHRLQFDELVEDRDLTRQGTGQRPQPGQYPIVIHKTYGWIGAENAREQEVTRLLKADLSPAEVIDFMQVEEGYRTTATSWAKKRNRSPQAISQNVKRAKEKLQEKYGK